MEGFTYRKLAAAWQREPPAVHSLPGLCCQNHRVLLLLHCEAHSTEQVSCCYICTHLDRGRNGVSPTRNPMLMPTYVRVGCSKCVHIHVVVEVIPKGALAEGTHGQ